MQKLQKLVVVSAAAVLLVGCAVIAKADQNDRDIDGSNLPSKIKYKVFVHYPNPGKTRVTPACVPTVNDQMADYGQTSWHFGSAKVYQLNESTVPRNVSVADVYTAVNNSWLAWNSASANINVSAGSAVLLSQAKYDGVNLISWGRVPNNAIAVTYTWYNTLTGEQVESDTIFNTRLKWSYTPYSSDCGGVAGTYDVGDIAIHEFGHWAGLNDLYAASDSDLTMYGYGITAELKKDTLGLGDMLGAAAINPQP